ncbi:hypothetical protein [Phycobacter sp. K97]|uniref:hypothetical protein n=1 Tax=Phycobacter sedimenti TaxID=3133977 RepID=UPI00311F9F16
MTTESDMEQCLRDTSAMYRTPGEILTNRHLTKAQKIEILRRWEYDACEVSVAEDEGMAGQDGELLREILLALETLVGSLDSDRTPPTKRAGWTARPWPGRKTTRERKTCRAKHRSGLMAGHFRASHIARMLGVMITAAGLLIAAHS